MISCKRDGESEGECGDKNEGDITVLVRIGTILMVKVVLRVVITIVTTLCSRQWSHILQHEDDISHLKKQCRATNMTLIRIKNIIPDSSRAICSLTEETRFDHWYSYSIPFLKTLKKPTLIIRKTISHQF